MKLVCQACNREYLIPDDRLPAGKKCFSFPCLACKNPVRVNLLSDNCSSSFNNGTTPSQKKDPGSDVDSDTFITGENIKKKILNRVRDLPPIPQVIFKAREVMSNPKAGTRELAQAIELDQAIVAKVLKMANSAYYGLRGKVSSVQHASTLLGNARIAEIITMASSSGLMSRNLEGYNMEARGMWEHSMAVAFGSKYIATKKHPALENDAFIAGLLHDAGKLVLDPYVLERKEEFKRFMEGGQATFLSAERKIFQTDHMDMAAEICKKWSIPKELIVAIRCHHNPHYSSSSTLAHIRPCC